MANKKRLQSMSTKFRRENPRLHRSCEILIKYMSRFIKESGAPEVTVGYNGGDYYEYPTE